MTRNATHRRRGSALCVGVTALLAACGSSLKTTPSEIVVTIDAEPGVRSATASLRVAAEGSSGVAALDSRVRRYANSIKPITFPKTIAFLPLGGNDKRVFVLTASAVDDQGAEIATARMISGYVPGEVRYARLLIEDACKGKPCGELETCSGAVCKDAKVAASKLSTIANKPRDVQRILPSGGGGSGGSSETTSGSGGSGGTIGGAAGEEPLAGAAGMGFAGSAAGMNGSGGEPGGAGGTSGCMPGVFDQSTFDDACFQ